MHDTIMDCIKLSQPEAQIKILSIKVSALETEVEKLTSYNNARSAIFSEQQVRLARLELLLSKVNLSHHVRG